MFADDTTIHTSDKDIEPLASSLQTNVHELQKWTELNHMALNLSKTKVMLITTRQKRQVLENAFPAITVSNHTLEEVRNHTLLGVTIDNNLSWTDHLSNVSKGLSKKTYQLTRIKSYLNAQSRKLFYTAHIQSAIDYASTLWDSASGNAMQPLVRVHRRAIKAVLMKPQINLIDYKTIRILPLNERLNYNKGVLMCKILAGKSPHNITQSFSLNTSRTSVKLNTPIPRLDLYKTSLRYSGSVLWNNLPYRIKCQTHRTTHCKKLLFDFFLENIT